MNIYYTAIESFTSNESGWKDYQNWIQLPQLSEVISLDPMLCPSVIEPDFENDMSEIFIGEDNIFRDLYTSLDYVVQKTACLVPEDYNIIAVIKEPYENEIVVESNFEFVGYDLMDIEHSASAITNCGGFYETYSPTDLNIFGLFDDICKAYDVRTKLKKNNPNEHHADCVVWGIWRKL